MIVQQYKFRNLIVLLGASWLVVLAIGCGGSDSQVADERPLPDGWSRVQVREGFVSRDSEDGFVIDLPPGWSAGESWPGSKGPSGWIAGSVEDDRRPVPLLEFFMNRGKRRDLEELLTDESVIVTQPVVEGVEAILYLAKENDYYDGPQMGIYFDRIPGAPRGEDASSLVIWGQSRGFVDAELAEQVLTSIRYRKFNDFPELPEHVLSPSNEWKRVPVRTDYPTFTVQLPPGWVSNNLQGADSLVGELVGDGVRLVYDFGVYGGRPYDANWANRDGGWGAHRIWEEEFNDIDFSFVRPLGVSTDLISMTGVFAKLNELADAEQKQVTMYSRVDGTDEDFIELTTDQQEIALAIFRTIEFE